MIIHALRVNILKMNEKIDIFSREIEGVPKNQVETFELIDTITELECPLETSKTEWRWEKKKGGQWAWRSINKNYPIWKTQKKKKFDKKWTDLKDLWDNIISSYTLWL